MKDHPKINFGKSFFNFDIGEEFRFALLGSRDLYSEKKKAGDKKIQSI